MCGHCDKVRSFREVSITLPVKDWVLLIGTFSIMRNAVVAALHDNDDLLGQLVSVALQTIGDISGPAESLELLHSMKEQLGPQYDDFFVTVPEFGADTKDLSKLIIDASETKELERIFKQNGPDETTT